MRLVAASVIALLVGCDGDPPEGIRGVSCEALHFPTEITPREVDLLVVVSDSASMAGLHDRLVTNLGYLANVLETIEGGVPSLRLAVVGPDGAFTTAPQVAGCSPPDGGFLSDTADFWWTCADEPGARCGESNYPGSLGDAIACISALAATGDTTPPPLLDRMVAALGPDNAEATAFFRPDAYLWVLFVSSDDDASSIDPVDAAAALHAQAGEGQALVSVVGPAASPRFDAFLAELPNRAASTAIDDPDWSDAFVLIAQLFKVTDGYRCEDDIAPADLDPVEPGLQLDCVATDIESFDPWQEVALPQCRMAAPSRPAADTPLPCYWFLEWDAGCDVGVIPLVVRAGAGSGQDAWLRCQCAAL